MTDRDIEKEANIFAVCLLIPRDMILKDLQKPIDLTSDDWINMVCKKYQVTPAMVAFRLAILNHKIK